LLGKCLESISRKHFWSFRVRKHFGSRLEVSKFLNLIRCSRTIRIMIIYPLLLTMAIEIRFTKH
jgi:hypothetical protein